MQKIVRRMKPGRERFATIAKDNQVKHMENRIDYRFRTPVELGKTVETAKRVLVIGSCVAEGLSSYVHRVIDGCGFDFIHFNNVGQLPDKPPRAVEDYDFQLIVLPLRTVMPERSYLHLSPDAHESYQELFESSVQRLTQFLSGALRYCAEQRLPAFVLSFLVPQQNPTGRFMPRYELSNVVHYVEQLNVALAVELKAFSGAYFVDINQIASTIGTRYVQDDSMAVFSHGGFLSDWDFHYDQKRIEVPRRPTELYESRVDDFILSIWAEAAAMYRTLRQIDSVKLVIVDLDDTLWRGVVAEGESIDPTVVEGWPLGFIEALQYLKKRGVLLAITSKNDEAVIERIWNSVVGGLISLDHFAVRKINWNQKAENIESILTEVNLLPKNVLFIDDNPTERASVCAAFPEIRTLGSNPYETRRLLLWAPELQLPFMTNESLRRTEMVQAQVQREVVRKQLTRAEFLASLQLKVRLFKLDGENDKALPRVLELINKTNQFNTTGRRWKVEELLGSQHSENLIYAFEVEDRFSRYGLVGVVVIRGNEIEQVVMSCRTVGLDAEVAAMSKIESGLLQNEFSELRARTIETESNFLSRDLFNRCGWKKLDDGSWLLRKEDILPVPDTIHMVD